ncbi:MAG: T9SS type B sorting domain-containing protein [Aureispira sp.]
MDSKNFPPSMALRCRRYLRVLLLAFGVFLMGGQEAQASHLAGADLTYQCLGNNRYVVTLTLYRDCAGISIGTFPQTINAYSDSCNLGFPHDVFPPGGVGDIQFQLPFDTSYEVSQLCPQVLPQSSCSVGNGGLPGIEVSIFRDTITLPAACTDWVISWSSCCRNPAITNIINPGGQNMYVEAGLNSTICNNSPTFNSNPVPYFCAGQCYNYNHGAFDIENDSLRYALTCVLSNPGTCIPNSAGFTPTNPMQLQPGTTFGFNQFTGQMSFCPLANTVQQPVIAVTVYNIVNGDTVGYVQRDIQMVVLNDANCTTPISSNNPLVNTGGTFDTTASSFVVCEGETLIFNLILSDPDGDTIRINPANTNLNQVFGASNVTIIPNTNPPYRPDSVQLFVQINAVSANLGVNQFTIGVTDGACPIPGDQILGYNLIIPGVEIDVQDTVLCPGVGYNLPVQASSFSSVGAATSGTFAWSQRSGIPITFNDATLRNPNITIPSGTIDGDSVVLNVSFATLPDPITGAQCFTDDTLTIYFRALPLAVATVASETSLCPNNQNDSITFTTVVGGPGVDLANGTYTWTANPTTFTTNLSSTTINNPLAIVSGGQNDSVTYTVTYDFGLCTGSDSVQLKWRPGIPDVTALNDTICPGDTTQLFGSLTDSIKVFDPAACSSYTVDPIAYAPIAGTGTQVSTFTFSSDDGISGALPIGFSFDFFCNTYTQFVMSTNGFISFDLNAPNGCCSGDFIPDAFGPNNLIALAWEDLNLTGDALEYFTVGTAPNRILVVNYTTVSHHPAPSNQPITVQALLYETTNVIEIHTTTQPDPNGNHTQGIENVDGTLGFAVPGRNSQTWTATNDAYRFTPSRAVLFGPFNYSWSPNVVLSDAAASDPRAFPQSTTTFQFQIEEEGCVQMDSIEVAVRSTIPIPTLTCGTPTNQATSVLFEWGGSVGAQGWEYSLDSGQTWIPRLLADSSLLVNNLTNGDCIVLFVRATGPASLCPVNGAAFLECCTTPCPMPNTSVTTDLNCFNSNDGTITITISGGVLGDHPTYTGTLFDTSGAQIGSPVLSGAGGIDSVVFTGLAAGSYYAYLTDTFGCFTNSDTVVLTQPDTLVLTVDTTTLTTCFADADGTGTVMVVGGTSAYNYLWDAAAASQVTATGTNLPRGTYTVTVTDANGCTDVTDVIVNSPFPGLPSITLNSTPSNSCSGNGTATVFSTFNMVGNANSYTYQWSNGTPNGPSVSDLPSGVTSVIVTDANGCTATASVTITGSPTVAITGMPTIDPGCTLSNGQITAVATGDSMGYSYQWSPNAGGQTTALVTGLPIGTYFVTVTGLSNGCSDIDTVNLVNNSALTTVGFNSNDPSCGLSDGDATVLTSGAAGTLNFIWTGGQTTNPATGLAAGTYFVTVTDPTTGCSDISSVTLVQPTLTANIDLATAISPSCNLNNGQLTVTAAGAPGPFTYLWSDGQTTTTATGLMPGTPYTVTVTYEGCTAIAGPITLSNDTLEIEIANKDDINCNGDASSYVNLELLRGNPANVTYLWSNGATTQDISNLTAGTYTVTVTSGTCMATQSINVVNVTLTGQAWINTPSDREASIQVNTQIDINAGVSTNFANPVYSWTEEDTAIVTITDPTIPATTITGTTGGDTWLYFNATAGVCTFRDSVRVTVESYLGMPTAFTPNGDNINDFFQPAGLMMSDKVLQFTIYNRWGQIMYSDNVNHSWDGTYQGVPQSQDAYIYVFEYVPDNGEPVFIRGEFMLIR